MSTNATTVDPERLDALLGQAVVDVGATVNAALVVIGDRLGLYRALAGPEAFSPSELAERTGTAERYVREWLKYGGAYRLASNGMDFRILGPLEVLDEGRVVAVGGSKQRALLALFLLHANETLTTDRLIDELWGDRPPATAAKNVQMRVSRLRNALAAGAAGGLVVTRERGYELELDPESLDAHRFERLLDEGRSDLAAGHPERALAALEAALALWRGAPLADLAHEPFAQGETARLHDLRAGALEQLVEAKLALGGHAEVVSQLETLIAEHPYRERLRAQLMLALYRCDRQADALQAYQDARRQLVEELGIEPGVRLRELERAVLAQDPALAAPLGPDDEEAGLPGPAPAELPTGVVTFLLTDIEDSSGQWEADAEGMAAALELHDELIACAVDAHAGRLLKTKGEGDATVSAFPRASDAVAAAVDIQGALGAASWPAGLELRARIALHTGEAYERAGDYFGPLLNRAARLRGLTRGGTTVMSQATAEIVHDRLPREVELVDLGRHELRGLSRPENVFELRPVAARAVPVPGAVGVEPGALEVAVEPPGGAFVERERELAELVGGIDDAVAGRGRLFLLGGEPGIGKSRLAERARHSGAEVRRCIASVYSLRAGLIFKHVIYLDRAEALAAVGCHPRRTRQPRSGPTETASGGRTSPDAHDSPHPQPITTRLAEPDDAGTLLTTLAEAP